MPVTAWRATLAGEEFGFEDGVISPPAFAVTIAQHEGEELVTYFHKPYTVRPGDAQSVYDFFDTEVDPHGNRVTTRWDYTPDEADASRVTP
jgi:hypothetical protein